MCNNYSFSNIQNNTVSPFVSEIQTISKLISFWKARNLATIYYFSPTLKHSPYFLDRKEHWQNIKIWTEPCVWKKSTISILSIWRRSDIPPGINSLLLPSIYTLCLYINRTLSCTFHISLSMITHGTVIFVTTTGRSFLTQLLAALRWKHYKNSRPQCRVLNYYKVPKHAI